jgi:hypothetical protein
MGLWHPEPASHAFATGPSTRRRRRYYRHQLQTLAYLNLDQSNGGIIRNLGDSGIAIQAVAPVRADQQVFLRFDLANPRVRVEGTGRVAWADPMGQAGIEFLSLSQRSRRGLKEWVFIQLLSSAQAAADMHFLCSGDTDGLLFSAAPRPAIRVEGTGLAFLEAGEKKQRPQSLHLAWFPLAVSAGVLSHLVDALIVLSAVLLFAVIGMSMIGAVPVWPVTLILGLAVSGLFATLYRFMFLFWIGATPGSYLARRASNAMSGFNAEADERPRFR